VSKKPLPFVLAAIGIAAVIIAFWVYAMAYLTSSFLAVTQAPPPEPSPAGEADYDDTAFYYTPAPTPGPSEEPAAVSALSRQDTELLARLLYAECRGEPREGWLMVAQCVFDRMEDGTWGSTVSEVVYALGQFAVPGQLTDELLAAAESAAMGERFLEGTEILYFRKTQSTADWLAPYMGHIGAHAYYGYER
jgi:spore germination cell wall hydrolase CwlJ-like protein